MTVGRAPKAGGGFSLQDSSWLLALAGGNNQISQSNPVALAGGAQAGAPILGGMNAQGVEPFLIRIATVVTAADSFRLVNAIAGKSLLIHNPTANACAIFAEPAVNKATGVVDIINGLANGTALSIPAGKIGLFFCAKDGFWSGSPLP